MQNTRIRIRMIREQLVDFLHQARSGILLSEGGHRDFRFLLLFIILDTLLTVELGALFRQQPVHLRLRVNALLIFRKRSGGSQPIDQPLRNLPAGNSSM